MREHRPRSTVAQQGMDDMHNCPPPVVVQDDTTMLRQPLAPEELGADQWSDLALVDVRWVDEGIDARDEVLDDVPGYISRLVEGTKQCVVHEVALILVRPEPVDVGIPIQGKGCCIQLNS